MVKEPDKKLAETFDLFIGAYEDGPEQYTAFHKVTAKVKDETIKMTLKIGRRSK